MTRFVPVAALLLLTACGADGPPTPPKAAAPTGTGVTITGDARVGVTTTF